MIQEEVNYIRHLNNVMNLLMIDEKIASAHIGFYMILFQKWNRRKFENPIKLIREDIMDIAMVNSRNTYGKYLNHLMSSGYIIYFPSKSSLVASKVYLINFSSDLAFHANQSFPMTALLNTHRKTAAVINKSDHTHTPKSRLNQIISNHLKIEYANLTKKYSFTKTKMYHGSNTKNASNTKLKPTGYEPRENIDYAEPL